MKLRNNKSTPVVFHYLSSNKGRKIINIQGYEVVEISDYANAVSGHLIDNQWLQIVDENVIKDKMKEAEKDAESYINSEESSKTEKKSKKSK